MNLKWSHSLLGQVGLHKNSGNGFHERSPFCKKIKEASDEASFFGTTGKQTELPL